VTSSSTKADTCPICGGVGYVRVDVPVGDPMFGKLQVCSCKSTEFQQATSQRLYRLSNLDSMSTMTFENFKIDGRGHLPDAQQRTLDSARSAVQGYAQKLDGWLLLMGPYGCGKTHLAAAAANFVVSLSVPTLFLTVPDLLDWLRYSYGSSDQSFEDRFEEIRNIRLLVLDDLGTQNATPWATEKLYQLINHRYVQRLPTIITTNLDLEEQDGRIRSRLSDTGLVKRIQIQAPDYRSPYEEASQGQISTLRLNRDYTFGNFSIRENEALSPEVQKNLQRVWKAAQQFAEKPRGWLVLTGVTGCGKTHLAAAVGNYVSAEGQEVIFISVSDLMDHLRSTFSPTSSISYDRLFEQVKTTGLLVLDDLGAQSPTPWAQEKLFQLLNYRYEARLATVITSTLSLEEMDERIRSRMLDPNRCVVYAIMAPAFRGGTRSLAQKKK